MGRPGLPSHLRREFWQQVRSGLSVEKAAAVSGVALCTARQWYRESGGVNPLSVSPLSGRYLSFQEREEIALGLAAGHDRLRAQVQAGLGKHWSPEQITCWLVVDFPDDEGMRVSHETIYRSLYVQGKGGLERELVKQLRSGRNLRKTHKKTDERRGRIKDMAEHAQFSIDTDIAVYFADPHSPWQRGTNENTNGLLRQYFPKGTSLKPYSADYLNAVADELNGRPRKVLGWQTPAEAFAKLLSESDATAGVIVSTP